MINNNRRISSYPSQGSGCLESYKIKNVKANNVFQSNKTDKLKTRHFLVCVCGFFPSHEVAWNQDI